MKIRITKGTNAYWAQSVASDSQEVKIFILSANLDPEVELQHVYNSGNPGQVSIVCSVQTLPSLSANELSSIAGQFKWTISSIDDSHATPSGGNVQMSWSNPWPGEETAGRGSDPTVTFTTLPPDNDDFGRKTITLYWVRPPTLLNPIVEFVDDVQVKIYFTKAATNHPGAGAWPNWYHYWSSTACSYDRTNSNPPPWYYYWHNSGGYGRAIPDLANIYIRTPAAYSFDYDFSGNGEVSIGAYGCKWLES